MAAGMTFERDTAFSSQKPLSKQVASQWTRHIYYLHVRKTAELGIDFKRDEC